MLFEIYWFLMMVLVSLAIGQAIETNGQMKRVRLWSILLGALLWVPMFIHSAPWR